jgi:glutamyl-tRNA reductase
VLGPLFRHAVEAGKRARTETAIQRGTTSLAHAAVQLVAERAGGLDAKRVLLIGAGEMGTGLAVALGARDDFSGHAVVANRSAARASEVASTLGARVAGMRDLDTELGRADVVLTSTAADAPVMGVEMFERALAVRSSAGEATPSPLVVLDLAIPRDVDPAVDALEGLLRLDVEDVRHFAEEQMANRRSEVPAVQAILAEELRRYRSSASGRLAAPVVAALRDRAEHLRAAEVERHRARLDALGPEARELVEIVSRRVVAKLLHDPTVQLKQAAGSPRGERLAEALRALFDL